MLRQLVKMPYTEAKSIIRNIADTEKTYIIGEEEGLDPNDIRNYSMSGLFSAGEKYHFPHKWLRTFSNNHLEKANEILKTCRNDRTGKLMYREFLGKIYGVLSPNYSKFDDKEVIKLLDQTSLYRGSEENIWVNLSPEHLHMRFIDNEKLFIKNDNSPLSMCTYIDNSMVGMGSLKVTFGLYRWACTNGVVFGKKDFIILRKIHAGENTWEFELASALKKAQDYKEIMLEKVNKLSESKSAIYNLNEEEAEEYLRTKLAVGKKAAGDVIKMYKSYGGETKWDLVNAITDYSHALDLDGRLRLESKAIKIA